MTCCDCIAVSQLMILVIETQTFVRSFADDVEIISSPEIGDRRREAENESQRCLCCFTA